MVIIEIEVLMKNMVSNVQIMLKKGKKKSYYSSTLVTSFNKFSL